MVLSKHVMANSVFSQKKSIHEATQLLFCVDFITLNCVILIPYEEDFYFLNISENLRKYFFKNI